MSFLAPKPKFAPPPAPPAPPAVDPEDGKARREKALAEQRRVQRGGRAATALASQEEGLRQQFDARRGRRSVSAQSLLGG